MEDDERRQKQQQQQPHFRIQSVVFMRHAVALHNVASANHANFVSTDPSWLDPGLTPYGKLQAVWAGSIVQANWTLLTNQALYTNHECENNNETTERTNATAVATLSSDSTIVSTDNAPVIELIVSSPLTRCLQTATLAFLPPGARNDAYGHPPARMICREEVREAFGIHYPDRRRPKSVLQAHWPAVEFDPDMNDVDTAWTFDRRERCLDVGHRVTRFLAWLVQQPQSIIAVVSHGVWIETLLQLYAPDALLLLSLTMNDTSIRTGLTSPTKRVYNTDAFQCEVVSVDGVFVRIQNRRQICDQQDVAVVCRETALTY